MYLLKQEASRLLVLPFQSYLAPPFRSLIYTVSHMVPKCCSLVSLVVSGVGAPSTEMPVLLSRLVCPNTSGRASVLPQALGEYSLVRV